MITKYRTYDEENKRFLDEEEFIITPDGRVLVGDWMTGNDFSYGYDEQDRFILMQSTGLFDKNGVEIFGGDIVKVSDDYGETDFLDGGIGTICGMDDIYMWYIDGEVQNGLFDIQQSYYIEVIGNIHQNPELLEASDD